MALVIGLTGGIGVGKSTAAAMFGERGAQVIDVDSLGRDVLQPAGEAYSGVVEAFGTDIVAGDGSIDRAALGSLVFGPNDRLAELEAISHPAINRALAQLLGSARNDLVVLDMAVLVESELGRTSTGPMYHRVVVVEAELDVRLDRLAQRGLTDTQARARMGVQASDHERRLVADLVITNNDQLHDLESKIGAIWPTIMAWQTQPFSSAQREYR